jgi:hypothetical protein
MNDYTKNRSVLPRSLTSENTQRLPLSLPATRCLQHSARGIEVILSGIGCKTTSHRGDLTASTAIYFPRDILQIQRNSTS